MIKVAQGNQVHVAHIVRVPVKMVKKKRLQL
jgi:hypothetical protein